MSTSTSPSLHSLLYLRPEIAALKRTLDDFVQTECIPAEAEYAAHLAARHGADRWTLDAIPPCLERCQRQAQQLGLWNLFIPPRLVPNIPVDILAAWARPRHTLTVREYGILCESLGTCPLLAPEACNTSAPDTGNMEVWLEFGTSSQQRDYLVPLLEGRIRSTFLMTEPAVASSDATNLQTRLQRVPAKDSDKTGTTDSTTEYILSGHKWWSTGAMDPRCRVALVVARSTDDDTNQRHHGAHTIVALALPHPNVTIVPEPLTLFGYDDAPHGHAQVILNDVRVTPDDIVGHVGQGFVIAQARLGPGRVHHCMRAIGTARRCFDRLVQRTLSRRTFGQYLWQHGAMHTVLSDCVADLTLARLVTLHCAALIDECQSGDTGDTANHLSRQARQAIALIKVAVPRLTYAVVDRAVQGHGAQGVKGDEFLARALVGLRSLRIADGPDAVHERSVALGVIRAAKETKVPSRL